MVRTDFVGNAPRSISRGNVSTPLMSLLEINLEYSRMISVTFKLERIITAMNTHIYGNYDTKNIYATAYDIDTLQFSKSMKS